MGGRFLLRIEDIDTVRCTPDKTTQMLEDLTWLGLEWQQPVMRQSQRFSFYQKALETLRAQGLVYPSAASRKDIQQAIKVWEVENHASWPRDPDGAAHFPRALLADKEVDQGDVAWRLNMTQALDQYPAPLFWSETGPRSSAYPASDCQPAAPQRWGDVVLARKDCPTSYHLSVILDDAAQNITHVVRGQDLFAATGLHRLLQTMLDLPAPLYHHHRLLTDVMGDKLSKSRGDLSLKKLRQAGTTPSDIRKLIAWSDDDLRVFSPLS